MIWMGVAWAATAEVPSDAYPTVSSACSDSSVDLILVGPEAGGGDSCFLSRSVTLRATDSSTRSQLPLVISSGEQVVLEGPFRIFEDDSGVGLTIAGGQVVVSDLQLDGGDEGGSYGVHLKGGDLAATDLELLGFWTGLYLQSEGTVVEVQGGRFEALTTAVSVNNSALGSDLRLEDVDFVANGTGAHVQAGGAIFTNCRFEGHTGTVIQQGSGAGLHLVGATVVDNKNSVIVAQHELTVEDSFFCGNSATNAAIDASGSQLELDHVAFVGNAPVGVRTSGQVDVQASHLTLVDNAEGIKMQGGSLEVRDSLLWGTSSLALDGVSVSGDHNAYEARPPALGPGEGDLEITDPGFVEAFDASSCELPPWLDEGSPLLGMASDGEAIGAYGLQGEEDDTGVQGSERSWISGGCGGGLPAAALLGVLPLLGLRRRP